MHIFDAPAVHAALPWSFLIEALRKAHLGPMPASDVMVQSDPAGGEAQFVTLPGWAPGGPIVVKMVGVFPQNAALQPPQPAVQGLVVLFDGATGGPLLAADGAAMTARKTAADSALGAALVAREDVEDLLIVGAGALAPHFAEAHLAARPSLRRVTIWNRTTTRAEAVAAQLRDKGIDATVSDDLDGSVARADVVSCVTMSDKALIKGALLRPGSHLDLVGAYLPTLREADDAALTRGTIFVDSRNNMEGGGDLSQAIASGAITWDAVKADLFELVQAKREGRTGADQITVFKNNGGAHLDLFTASALSQTLS
ncbi:MULTISPECIES: ornithine cyclodeaminase [unclassified Rhizobium]|uniref:ornithine cyclodeaminase n=1 Tax=unclassified Rhizobium TaxID=2613769 RepID=UPI0006F919A4|nr:MULTISPECIES: ornithine cyclodeaminase [unclassified Rhizobium]KQV40776.1 ornithine cyclodeaminase [Rhizobium sp. Root1212]KRD36064.1 ornithine cyclodeaminase [Rhizobium sp. Root268]